MDTLVIKRLKAEALRDWKEDKHISSITITDEDKLQKNMEEV